jgi:hypothetical protein
MPKITNDSEDAKLDKLFEDAKSLDLRVLSPDNNQELDSKTVSRIILAISDSYGIPQTVAYIGIILLFLKGAANAKTPDSLSVKVTHEGTDTEIQKYALFYNYKMICKNNFLRRLAESLKNKISQYAEANSLDGDLASQINKRLLAEGKDPMTLKQKAWCSSFNQNNPIMEKDPNLLVVSQLLAKDFNFKFKSKRQGETKKKETQSSARPTGPGKSKTNINKPKKNIQGAGNPPENKKK